MALIEIIHKWAIQLLLEKEYDLLGEFENIQETAWSSVSRILTSSGYIYLKQVPPLLALEPTIIRILHDKLQANIPVIIDVNKKLNIFLMKDSGKAFYHFNKGENRISLISNAISSYKYIQNKSIPFVNDLIKLGVPDWRIKNLPELYKKLIDQEEVLLEDGFSENEINKLSLNLDKCTSLCKELDEFQIPETLDHCDLHGGNILIDEHSCVITIIDWGETVITHPFFSLSFFLRGLVKYYSFQESELWDVLFANEVITNKKDLLTLVELAKKLEPIYSALAFHRLLLSSNKEKFMQSPNCRGRITKYLEEFIHS